MSSQGPDLVGLNLEEDPWLSKVTGMRALIVTEKAGADNSAVKFGKIERTFVTAKVPVSEVKAISDLTKRGFVVVDTAVYFQWTPKEVTLPLDVDHPSQVEGGIIVRAAKTDDADAVVALTGRAFIGSRFHLDPDFPVKEASRIKREWARNLVLGTRGNGCLVATINGQVVGFLGILKRHTHPRSYAIDLVAVDPDAQRKGIGKAMLSDLLDDATRVGRLVEVGTQVANVPSVRLYEALGFRYAGAIQVLHAHDRGERSE
jgi:ribosomal protein S18 acetylase RimI-like enzyme